MRSHNGFELLFALASFFRSRIQTSAPCWWYLTSGSRENIAYKLYFVFGNGWLICILYLALVYNTCISYLAMVAWLHCCIFVFWICVSLYFVFGTGVYLYFVFGIGCLIACVPRLQCWSRLAPGSTAPFQFKLSYCHCKNFLVSCVPPVILQTYDAYLVELLVWVLSRSRNDRIWTWCGGTSFHLWIRSKSVTNKQTSVFGSLLFLWYEYGLDYKLCLWFSIVCCE